MIKMCLKNIVMFLVTQSLETSNNMRCYIMVIKEIAEKVREVALDGNKIAMFH